MVYVPAGGQDDPQPGGVRVPRARRDNETRRRDFAYHKHWPEAIAVYMQGLNTPGVLTDPEGKRPGWQKRVGDQNDRDLKFFDAVLATLKKDYRVDEKRVYATGHSNGGAFTYLLWAARGDVLRRPWSRRARAAAPPADQDSSPNPCCTWRARMILWCGSRGRSGPWTPCGNSTAAARASPGRALYPVPLQDGHAARDLHPSRRPRSRKMSRRLS